MCFGSGSGGFAVGLGLDRGFRAVWGLRIDMGGGDRWRNERGDEGWGGVDDDDDDDDNDGDNDDEGVEEMVTRVQGHLIKVKKE